MQVELTLKRLGSAGDETTSRRMIVMGAGAEGLVIRKQISGLIAAKKHYPFPMQ